MFIEDISVISLKQPVELWKLSRRLGLGTRATANLFRAYYFGRRLALQKLSPKSLVIDLPRWGKVVVRVNGYDHRLLQQIFLREDYKLQGHSIRRVLDLGANIGAASLYFSKLFPEAEFACVEPSPQNTPFLRRMLGLNNVRARVFEAAIGSEQGEIELYLSREPDCTSIYRPGNVLGVVKVPLITVPEVLRQMNWDSVDLLKIDVEGAERLVLTQNNSWLSKVRMITGESHVNVGYPYARMEKDLAGFGFVLECLIPETADYGASFRGTNTRFEGVDRAPA